MANQKVAKVAVYFPGQAIRFWPDVTTLEIQQGLEAIVKNVHSAFEETVGKELAAEALQADKDGLQQNTQFAQLRGFYTSTVFWLAF
ncbi:MAG: hypothetical protein AABX69_00150, partial [Nanoarchaeota archaeon]